MGDEYRADPDTQQQQPKILGTATIARRILGTPRRRVTRMHRLGGYLSGGRFGVGQRRWIVQRSNLFHIVGARQPLRLVLRDCRGLEVAAVGSRRHIIFRVDQFGRLTPHLRIV
ncbi:Uncharacterised protein [Mycobacteroides abscessus subsp. massiliense]|nr:Uncharacterised protein [Mycobacteroides abscessus subsp. massiliense]